MVKFFVVCKQIQLGTHLILLQWLNSECFMKQIAAVYER